MNMDELRAKLIANRQERYAEAVANIALSRELMKLEPLDEPLLLISLSRYEVIEGIDAERRRIFKFDWSDFVEASASIESTVDCAVYKWLEGMNLLYEGVCLDGPEGSAYKWYVTNKVALLAKLTFGGNVQ